MRFYLAGCKELCDCEELSHDGWAGWGAGLVCEQGQHTRSRDLLVLSIAIHVQMPTRTT